MDDGRHDDDRDDDRVVVVTPRRYVTDSWAHTPVLTFVRFSDSVPSQAKKAAAVMDFNLLFACRSLIKKLLEEEKK